MRVAILAFPRFQLLDVAGPADVFRGVASARPALGLPGAGDRPAGARCRAAAACGWRWTPRWPRSAARIDTLLVAGSPDIDDMASDTPLQDWLRRQSRTVRRYGSVCTGAFVLAATGLLDGKRVATHWNSRGPAGGRLPRAQVEADAIHVQDGKLFTSAGVTAGMDLALAMVEEDHGRDLALRVARELVMFLKRPGGQSQFSAHLAAQTAERSGVRDVQDYVLAHLKADLSVPRWRHAGMSERSFARIFRSETGTTPAEFVEKARIDAARRLAEESDLPAKRLGRRGGLCERGRLPARFRRRLGVSLTQYRKRFAS
jgi:transcriptional regulator GlxA family with amidase domain